MAEGRIIRALLTGLFFLASVTVGSHDAAGSAGDKRGDAQDAGRGSVVSALRRPDLELGYSKAAKFKLASRKTEYHVGEKITLDAAMINVSGAPIFLRKMDEPVLLQASDEQGNKVKIISYINATYVLTPGSYTLFKPNEMDYMSLDLLAGCDERAFEYLRAQIDDEDDKAAFEQNLFVSFGRGCLDTIRPGTYTITALVSNDHVLTRAAGVSYKTATGSIVSSPLTIKITERQ